MDALIGNKETEKKVLLSKIEPTSGKVFRFATDSFQKAIDEKLFYRVSNEPATRSEQLKLINPFTGEILQRDNTHLVIEHEATLTIFP